ncbi:FecR family protein [Methylomonas methanica]|uniref:Anti-FecI sigma factor, FecR n=1 Tax=Methylomonas methanica (strain DSM 25384 / MC09) TaxID=857087 RepID=G0A101_METMM|nr:FecR family protein [Methylomonas methanica]AEG01257.1 anti-FecI sigma factor, FecR [Methylomonas methanica MC09]
MSKDNPLSSDSISDQASAWFARLQADDVSAEERGRFQAWYHARPQHAEAYDKTRKLWSLLQIPAEQVYNRLQAENPSGKSTQDHEPVQSAETAAPQLPVTGKPTLRLAVLGCLSLLLLLAGWQLPKQLQNWRSDYHTAAGQQLNVELADGSRLTLNTDTALAVRFSENQRRIELLRGEAYFQVAPNKQRPFIVDGGDAEARAVGTAFSVRKQAENLRVAVSEGVVEVGTGSAATLVQAEQQVDVLRKRLQPVFNAANDDAFAWQRRQVVFNRQPLAEVLDEVNRYRSGRIVAVNPALAERVLSGVFNVADADAVTEALQATMHAQAVELPGGLVLLY